MSIEQSTQPRHDLRTIVEQFPELSLETPMSERSRLAIETKYKILLQIADQSLKDRELKLKEGSSKVDRWTNPLIVGILAGALGLVGTFINGIISNNNQRTQLENDLIKEAIKPESEQERAKSLVFFANNGLIRLDSRSLSSLIKIAGSDQPIPASSVTPTSFNSAVDFKPIYYDKDIVNNIKNKPGIPYPDGIKPQEHHGDTLRRFIILHETPMSKNLLTILKNGRPYPVSIDGPLAHWAVLPDGTIVFIADETVKANHTGHSDFGVTNSNSIGVEFIHGVNEKPEQLETFVRLVADIADRWEIPTSNIRGHAEVAPKRKTDMQQQAPIIRQMVDEVRKK